MERRGEERRGGSQIGEREGVGWEDGREGREGKGDDEG